MPILMPAMAAPRNTGFAIISAIEMDLRAFIRDLSKKENKPTFLPKDVSQNAKKRWDIAHKSYPEQFPSDADLLDYIDFMDISKTLNAKFNEACSSSHIPLKELTKIFEDLHPARNRICHARPLDLNDLELCLTTSESLLDLPGILFQNLRDTTAKLEKTPNYALEIEIPDYWRKESSISHQLPIPESDDTGFLGRQEDLNNLRKAMQRRPVVNIIGEGGVGKTALALLYLYEIVYSENPDFDAVVWVSLKTQTVTFGNIEEINNSITDTIGLLNYIADDFGADRSSKSQEIIDSIATCLAERRILLAIDNVETIAGEDELLTNFIKQVPMSDSRVLLTSRINLQDTSTLKLDPLPRRTSIRLMRSYAKALSLNYITQEDENSLSEKCRLLFDNPLLIKWFLAGVARGIEVNQDAFLNREGQLLSEALGFCCRNLFEKLTQNEKIIAGTLVAIGTPLTLVEMKYLCQPSLNHEDVNRAVISLNCSCLLICSNTDSNVTAFSLSESAATYFRTQLQLDTEFQDVRSKLRELRNSVEMDQVKRERNRFDVNIIETNTSDQVFAAKYLHEALRLSRQEKIKEALEQIEKAKNLHGTFAENYRIAGRVLSLAGKITEAYKQFDHAVHYNPDSSLVRYTYALFLIDKGEYSEALKHLNKALEQVPNDLTLESSKALALMRFGKHNEAAELYDSVVNTIVARLGTLAEPPKQWRTLTFDQAAECHRRLAESARINRDRQAFEKHIEHAFSLVETAAEKNSVDNLTPNRLGRILSEAISFAHIMKDRDYANKALTTASTLVDALPASEFVVNLHDQISDDWPDIAERIQSFGGYTTAYKEGEILQGTIHNLQPRYGFLSVQDRPNIFFHITSLRSPICWSVLEEGMDASFRVASKDDRLQAIDLDFTSENGKPLHHKVFLRCISNSESVDGANFRKTRISIIWAMFESEVSDNGTCAKEIFASLLKRFSSSDVDSEFANNVFRGLTDHLSEIDDTISANLQRLSSEVGQIEQCILRLAVFELQFATGVGMTQPRSVIINEAVEVTKILTDNKTHNFVNNLLQAVGKNLPPISKTQVGGLVYRVDDHVPKFALLKNGIGKWTLSKGSLKDKEEDVAGFRRVIKEELGLDVDVVSTRTWKQTLHARKPSGRVRKEVTYFEGVTNDETFSVQDKPGIQCAKWFTYEEAKNLDLYPEAREKILDLMEQVVAEHTPSLKNPISWIKNILEKI